MCICRAVNESAPIIHSMQRQRISVAFYDTAHKKQPVAQLPVVDLFKFLSPARSTFVQQQLSSAAQTQDCFLLHRLNAMTAIEPSNAAP